ncbi:MAG: hypothetical protein QM530_10405 [Phycisphaerales bacterium]|nr:hypothetical protein [Phycisphaerales bacterium]
MLVSIGYDTATEATIAGNTITFLNRLAEDEILMKNNEGCCQSRKVAKEVQENEH